MTWAEPCLFLHFLDFFSSNTLFYFLIFETKRSKNRSSLLIGALEGLSCFVPFGEPIRGSRRSRSPAVRRFTVGARMSLARGCSSLEPAFVLVALAANAGLMGRGCVLLRVSHSRPGDRSRDIHPCREARRYNADARPPDRFRPVNDLLLTKKEIK